MKAAVNSDLLSLETQNAGNDKEKDSVDNMDGNESDSDDSLQPYDLNEDESDGTH